MKAIIYKKYGSLDFLKLSSVEKPVPKDNEVLIKIYASSINYSDSALVRGKPFIARLWSGFIKPKYNIPGADIAGCVESVGHNVEKFKIGDDVFGDISDFGWGGFAEYVSVHEDAIAIKPLNLSYEEASAIPQAAVVALQALRNKGALQSGQKILINGASGGIGTFAIQIARAFGAEVTAVCSTDKIELAKSLGANHVLDYKKLDFTDTGLTYDLVLGVQGYRSLSDYNRVLKKDGTYVATGGSLKQVFECMFLGPYLSLVSKKRIANLIVKRDQTDLTLLRNLIESGKIVPVIDKIYKLSEVTEAIKYYEKGHSKGKIVITID